MKISLPLAFAIALGIGAAGFFVGRQVAEPEEVSSIIESDASRVQLAELQKTIDAQAIKIAELSKPSVPVKPPEPTFDTGDVQDKAFGIFHRLCQQKELEADEDVWLKSELNVIEDLKLRTAVEDEIARWQSNLAGSQEYRIKFDFARSDLQDNTNYVCYGHLEVDGTVLPYDTSTSLADLNFEWKPGQPITLTIYVDDVGLDTVAKTIAFSGKYAIWNLHQQGIKLSGEYDGKPFSIVYQVVELNNDRFPNRNKKVPVPINLEF